MRILITGGNGFIGSHVLESLLQDGENDIGITLRTTSNIWRIKRIIQERDIALFYLENESIEEIISMFKPEIVIHLSVYYKKNHNYDDIAEMLETNIIFPTKILDSMVKNGLKFFINTGTTTEFLIEEKYLTSNSKISPSNLYSATKVAFEEILKYYTLHQGIQSITLKLAYPYGPKDNPKKLIPYLINCAIKGETAKATLGEQNLDYIYVKDIANAYKAAVDFIIRKWNKYEVFIIGSGKSIPLREIAKLINEISNNLLVEWGAFPYDQSESYHVRIDPTKALNVLGWKPLFSLRDGIIETYNFYRRGLENE